MNQDTESLLFDVAGRLERAIIDRDCPAMVALQGDRTLVLSDYDYLRDEPTAAAFEHRAAERAREIHTSRFVFAVPQVWVDTDDTVQARAVSNHPLREDEREVIAWMSYDAHDGVDYGFVPYVRRPNGEPIFADPEVFTALVRPREQAPGWTLLRALMEDGTEPTDTL
ncbi:hypothetical protein [Streptomyces sp. GQFP]|uniref:hypothetical protein n=1 Tax=Streptomyces sp. GQFP TaxID=2907545 RepID=UPI001F43316B|nr:hypothetical protein [Streptomyces sp. GQFP]UIX34329.1 hypothetical protein LUX31_32375 [Streptomyces sp. GQFP]